MLIIEFCNSKQYAYLYMYPLLSRKFYSFNPFRLNNCFNNNDTWFVGYGKGYKYNPDFQGQVEQEYLPPELKGTDFFA